MKRNIKIILLLLFAPSALFAQVHFEQGLSWQQIKDKAKKERKYIFIDCYATWCVPCKKMDQEVYPDPAIAEVMNQLFICVKVQMDSTRNDNEQVKAWHDDARKMMNAYKVGTFPTSLFLSSKGDLLHKYVGYSAPINFLTQALDAIDSEKQEYAMLDRLQKGNLPDYAVPSLINGLERAEDINAAKTVAQQYIHNYLLRLPDSLLFKRDNMAVVGKYLESSKDSAFALFYTKKAEVDKAAGNGFADRIIWKIITEEEIYPKIWADGKRTIPATQSADWNAIAKTIKQKYKRDDVDQIMLTPKIEFYKKTQNWPLLLDAYAVRIKTAYLDSAGHLRAAGADAVNNTVFAYFFTYGSKNALDQAIGWQKQVVDLNPNEPDYQDTYASLLYKAGKKKEAIEWDTKALALKQAWFKKIESEGDLYPGRVKAKKVSLDEIETNLKRMKTGEITWQSNK